MTAAEALRKARATADCNWRKPCFSDWLDSQATDDGSLINHDWSASALLDGFTVEELTEAGG